MDGKNVGINGNFAYSAEISRVKNVGADAIIQIHDIIK